jgi:hypothetical protein
VQGTGSLTRDLDWGEEVQSRMVDSLSQSRSYQENAFRGDSAEGVHFNSERRSLDFVGESCFCRFTRDTSEDPRRLFFCVATETLPSDAISKSSREEGSASGNRDVSSASFVSVSSSSDMTRGVARLIFRGGDAVPDGCVTTVDSGP